MNFAKPHLRPAFFSASFWRKLRFVCLANSGLFLLAGCGNQNLSQPSSHIAGTNLERSFDSAEISPARPLVYANVKPILDARCVTCHRSGGAASFLPLTTLAQIKPARVAMFNAIASRSMPVGDAAFATTSRGQLLLNWLRSGSDVQ